MKQSLTGKSTRKLKTKISNMSEKELKQEKVSKIAVVLPLIILITTLLFLTSCSSTRSGCGSGFTWGAAAMNCPAYR